MKRDRLVSARPLKAGLAAALIALLSAAAPVKADEARRIVSIGGSITEIVYALGEQDRLIARDSTSFYPEEAQKLPDVGYIRQLSPEGVLSVNPDLILAQEGFGPPEAASVIAKSGIKVIEIPDGYDRAAIIEKIHATASALDRKEAGDTLAAKVDAELAATEAAAAGIKEKRKVLFLLATTGGRLMAGGADTHANGIIELAGGVNAMSGFSGYKEVSNESVIEAAPDVILRMLGGRDPSSDEDVLKHPAIALTPAAKAGKILGMNGLYILGFGPRTAQAAAELSAALYGDKPAEAN
jgi:iron complex transport system substrate-binding protein